MDVQHCVSEARRLRLQRRHSAANEIMAREWRKAAEPGVGTWSDLALFVRDLSDHRDLDRSGAIEFEAAAAQIVGLAPMNGEVDPSIVLAQLLARDIQGRLWMAQSGENVSRAFTVIVDVSNSLLFLSQCVRLRFLRFGLEIVEAIDRNMPNWKMDALTSKLSARSLAAVYVTLLAGGNERGAAEVFELACRVRSFSDVVGVFVGEAVGHYEAREQHLAWLGHLASRTPWMIDLEDRVRSQLAVEGTRRPPG